ncbi:MAG: M15 family metallopeptidase [Muribaculaceae bacterium]|nr:M15 family metallopeptidase [Muribaculaceae bacterium]
MKPFILTTLAILLGNMLAYSAEPLSALEMKLEADGYVDVAQLDSTIVIDLMYARPDNFVGEVLYTDLHRAYLHPEAAQAVVTAQKELRKLHPAYSLKICDAARPMSVQKRMYRKVAGTPQAPYVSNPARGGGLHNYGLAVDITIVGPDGKELDMGTPVDYLGKEANIDREQYLVRTGKISKQSMTNRELLRRVMTAAGFRPLKSEWWHFNLRTRAQARASYKLIE